MSRRVRVKGVRVIGVNGVGEVLGACCRYAHGMVEKTVDADIVVRMFLLAA